MLYSRINSCATASSSSDDLVMRQSVDPAFAKECAIDTPMPLPAPVMTTTGSLRFAVVDIVVLSMDTIFRQCEEDSLVCLAMMCLGENCSASSSAYAGDNIAPI